VFFKEFSYLIIIAIIPIQGWSILQMKNWGTEGEVICLKSHKTLVVELELEHLKYSVLFSIYPTTYLNWRFSCFFKKVKYLPNLVFCKLCTCERLNAVIRFLSLCEVTIWLHISLCRCFLKIMDMVRKAMVKIVILVPFSSSFYLLKLSVMSVFLFL
jgi:hypothetical protein